MNDIGQIQGLEWQENQCIRNDQASFVGFFPTSQPINLVFRDDREGPYAIHLGQDDYLTFLGSTTNLITGYFIDCRQDSPTLHQRVKVQFYPNPRQTLHIAPGIAHSFGYSEKIFVINSYKLFLPDLDRWLTGEIEWTLGNDAIVLPLDVSDADLPTVIPNEFEASELLYRQIARDQQKLNAKPQLSLIQDISLDNGQIARLCFRKRQQHSSRDQWQALEGIAGAGWGVHPVVWMGEDTGVAPILETSPLYLNEYHCDTQSHFLIQLSQEDCLTFLRIENQPIRVTLVDCRQDSITFHNQVQFDVSASPLQFLVIPVGVAYRLDGISDVLTLNRPRVVIKETEPQGISFAANQNSFPTVNVNQIPAALIGEKLTNELSQSFQSKDQQPTLI